MSTRTNHEMKTDAAGEPAINQGVVHGHPVTYNPDDGHFYIHAAGAANGTNVLETCTDWSTAVQTAARLSTQGEKASAGN